MLVKYSLCARFSEGLDVQHEAAVTALHEPLAE